MAKRPSSSSHNSFSPSYIRYSYIRLYTVMRLTILHSFTEQIYTAGVRSKLHYLANRLEVHFLAAKFVFILPHQFHNSRFVSCFATITKHRYGTKFSCL